MKNLTIFIFGLLLFFSCSPKPETTSAKISFGASFGPNEFPGGLYILGHNPDTKVVFTKRLLNTTTYEVDLDNGKWEFGAVGWDASSSAMAGTPKCFITGSPVKLDGSPIDINLTPSLTGCGDEPFRSDEGNYNEANGSPRPAEFIACTKGDDEIDEGDDCAEDPGVYKSYKIVSYDIDFAVEDRMFEKKSNPFESVCITDGTGDHHVLRNDLVRPLIFKGIPQSIIAYSEENCGGTGDKIDFKNGFHEGSQTVYGSFVKTNTATNTNTFYIRQPLCPSYAKTNPGYDTGNGGLIPWVICTQKDLEDINLLPGDNYLLGDNISISNFTTITNNFSGKLFGNDKIISGLDKPLFQTIIDGSVIRNFTLKSPNISRNEISLAVLGQYAGVTSADIKIKNISFENAYLKNNNISGSSTGLLIGQLQKSSGSGQIKIEDIDTFGGTNTVISSDITSTNGTGGLIGNIISSYPNDYIKLNEIEVNNLDIKSHKGRVGGIIGSAQNVQLTTGIVKDSTIGAGNSYSGGLIGHGENIKLHIVSFDKSSIDCIKNMNNTVAVYCSEIGGIAGKIFNYSVIDQAMADFILHDSDDGLQNVGGIVGLMGDASIAANLVNNSGTRIDFKFNGLNIGGLVGALTDTAAYNSDSNIKSSLSSGSIHTENQDALNINRGGIVGEVPNGGPTIRFCGAVLDSLIGDSNIGGIAGINEGWIQETFVRIPNILAENNTNDDYNVGGFIGLVSGAGRIWNSMINETEIRSSAGDCEQSRECGLFIGLNTNAGTSLVNRAANFNSIVPTTVKIEGNTYSDDIYDYIGGTTHNLEHFTSVFNFADLNTQAPNAAVVDTSFSGGGFNAGGYVGNLAYIESSPEFSGLPAPTFMTKWLRLGFKDVGDGEGQRLLIGNLFDPFPIKDHNEWNEIQDDAFLLTKTMALAGDISFNGEPFYPIGSKFDGNIKCDSSKVFTGGLLASRPEFNEQDHGFQLRDITIDIDSDYDTASTCTGSAHIGIITSLGDSALVPTLVGTKENPLIIKDITISNTSVATHATGSLAGVVQNGFITARASSININDSTGSSYVGGLIGHAGTLSITNSSIQVDITTGSSSNTGGLIGSQSSGDLIAYANKVEIGRLNSGDNYVGGFAGSLNPSSQFISNNLVSYKNTANVISTGGSGSLYGFSNITSLSNTSDNLVVLDINNIGAGSASDFAASGIGGVNNVFVGDAPGDGSGANRSYNTIQDMLDADIGFEEIFYDNESNRFVMEWELEPDDLTNK